jgi:Ca-activated chloride channel homolog
MNRNYQDYELTAYLLGELDEQRRRELEDIFSRSPEARAELDEMRESMNLVGSALAEEPSLRLGAAQRAALERELEQHAGVYRHLPGVQAAPRPKRVFLRWAAAMATAASLFAVLVLSWDLVNPPREADRRPVLSEQARSAAEPGPTTVLVPGNETVVLERPETDLPPSQPADSGQPAEPLVLPPAERASKEVKTPRPSQPAFAGTVLDAVGDVTSTIEVTGNKVDLARATGQAASTAELKDDSRLRAAAAPTANLFRLPARGKAEPGMSPGTPRWEARTTPPIPDEADRDFNTEAYDFIAEGELTAVAKDPLSTFSIDVDTASYSNVRRFLREGRLPPPDAVRIEELVNYFVYDYEGPRGNVPFAVHTEVGQAPWKPEHRLVRIALKGKDFAPAERPAANLVFLIDVSGSMNSPVKLPLVKEALRLLIERLEAKDRVAIVVYAGASGLVLPSTSGSNQERILNALEQLEAGGSTNGGEGIRLAYQQALASFDRNAVNRVILCTDGDFNVGMTNQGELVRLVQEQAQKGIFLTVLGFGMGNYKDSMLEKLADKGNGNYAYVDGLDEARKVLVEQAGGTLVTIAKDVKIQVEFNPQEVTAYRLIGYENRVMPHQDFEDDRKDAGEIGAGHTVTALYEVVPAGVHADLPPGEPLKYQRNTPAVTPRGELMTVKLRYKRPNEENSQSLEQVVTDSLRPFEHASDDLRFASAVAAFGMLLRNSPHKGSATFDAVISMADTSRSFDPQGYRAEFVRLVHQAKALAR